MSEPLDRFSPLRQRPQVAELILATDLQLNDVIDVPTVLARAHTVFDDQILERANHLPAHALVLVLKLGTHVHLARGPEAERLLVAG